MKTEIDFTATEVVCFITELTFKTIGRESHKAEKGRQQAT